MEEKKEEPWGVTKIRALFDKHVPENSKKTFDPARVRVETGKTKSHAYGCEVSGSKDSVSYNYQGVVIEWEHRLGSYKGDTDMFTYVRVYIDGRCIVDKVYG